MDLGQAPPTPQTTSATDRNNPPPSSASAPAAAAASGPIQEKGESKDVAKDKLPVVTIATNMGNMTCELFEDDAPNTVANFISLAEKGFYNGTKFHRIIKDFMIQGGDPNSKGPNYETWGTGGPGYSFEDEFSSRRNERYALSMANAGPNTNGSQFFIITKKDGTPWLDGKHSVFGRVLQGQDVADAIEKVATALRDRPMNDVVIQKIVVDYKRNHRYEPRVHQGGR
ncbi:MAG: peptidylprolyl isomerase [Candidatus Riflebacteria bacterium]|nr:peptidylprolyl isomerase [Candidatus Riflebacteria bacterium]